MLLCYIPQSHHQALYMGGPHTICTKYCMHFLFLACNNLSIWQKLDQFGSYMPKVGLEVNKPEFKVCTKCILSIGVGGVTCTSCCSPYNLSVHRKVDKFGLKQSIEYVHSELLPCCTLPRHQRFDLSQLVYIHCGPAKQYYYTDARARALS